MHERVFADPLNEHITASSFAAERQTIVNKAERLRDHPHDAKAVPSAKIT